MPINFIDQDTVLRATLTIPLKSGGKIVISPNGGIEIVGTQKAVTTPSITIDEEGIKGVDSQGTLQSHLDASTGKFLNIGGSDKVPRGLDVGAIANGLNIISGAIASENTEGIDIAEFRASFVAVGAIKPVSVDLRTVDEGGTFAHDGITYVHVGCIGCNPTGVTYKFTSAAAGRWYYTWRLKNQNGWSLWSDGNPEPSLVTDFIDTTNLTDSGPPAGWTVTLENNSNNTATVRATRPLTNGGQLLGWKVQIKDANTAAWTLVDSNALGATTVYDGSAANHSLSGSGIRITKDSGSGFGTANLGDLVLMDVRGENNYDVQYCQWRNLNFLQGNNATTATYLEVDAPFIAVSANNCRLRIVKHPTTWNTNGYFGAENDHGFVDAPFGAMDVDTQLFVAPGLKIPAGTVTPEGRVWFTNAYSTADDNNTHSTGTAVPYDQPAPSGTVFNNFSDSNSWIFLRGNPAITAYNLQANGSLYVAGNAGFNNLVSAYSLDFTGVISRGTFLPDANNGNLTLKVSVSNYNPPTDQNNTASARAFAIGLGLLQEVNIFSMPAVDEWFYMGYMSNNTTTAFRAANAAQTTALSGWTALLTQNYTMANMANMQWSATLYFKPGGILGVNGRFFKLDSVVLETSLGNNTFDFSANSASTMFTPWYNPLHMGFRVALGCIPSQNSANSNGTFTGLELLEGRFYPEGKGGDPTFKTYTPPSGGGPQIFGVPRR